MTDEKHGIQGAEPPVWSRAALWLLLPRRDREPVLSELEEHLSARASRGGFRRARWWYRRQVVRFAVALVVDAIPRFRGTRAARSEFALQDKTERVSNPVGVIGDGTRSVGRTVRRAPGFVTAIAVTLGLGIGVNAAMFGVLDRLFLRPPTHVTDAASVRRIFVERQVVGEQWTEPNLTFPGYLDLVPARGFSGVAAYTAQSVTVGRGEAANRVRAVMTTSSFFDVLGVEPYRGRFYDETEDRVGASGVAVVSYEYWRRVLGGGPDVIGRPLDLRGDAEVAGAPFTIVGVAPPGFTGVDLEAVDVWLPLETTNAYLIASDAWRSSRGWYQFMAVARLAPDIDAVAAALEATRLHRAGHAALAESGRYDPEASITLYPLLAARSPDAPAEARVARWVSGVALIVFLIACANVANLLLARAVGRRRETSVRLALGIGRGRLLLEGMTEAVGLAAIGGVLALLLSHWGGLAIRRLLFPGILFPGPVIGPTTVAVVCGFALVAGLLAGLLPAMQAARIAPAGDLRSGGGGSARRSKLRSSLAVAQVSLSVVLLACAGLFVRSLQRVNNRDLGLDVDRLLDARIELTDASLPAFEVNRIYEHARAALARVPGVESTTLTMAPFRFGWGIRVRIPGRDSIPRLPGGGPYYFAVTPGYFATTGIDILRGRAISDRDTESAERVAVVSETAANTLWPGAPAIGKCMLLGAGADVCTTVVGVAEDASRGSIQDAAYIGLYLPLTQVRATSPDPTPSFGAARGAYVRVSREAEEMVGRIAPVLRGLDPRIRFATVEPLRRALDSQTRAWSLGATLFSAFGILALLTAAVGLYSLLAFAIARRVRELGIRSAVGASRARLLGDVVIDGTTLAATGVAIGLLIAIALAGFVEPLLFDVAPRDPAILTGVALVMLAVAMLACLVPGYRATTVDPAAALRQE